MNQIAANGIDVSDWQGDIEWGAAKNNVDFAILKMGFGSDEPSQDDARFERNVSECERLGIPWGAYLYSYAMDLNEAESEYRHILRLLNGKKPAYPVYIDMEDADGYKARRGVSNQMCADICADVCSRLESTGYYAGIYANLDWFENRLHDGRLDRYDKWVAQYCEECRYAGDYGMWQRASNGSVAGVSGNVDLNVCYKRYPEIIRQAGLNGWGHEQQPENPRQSGQAQPDYTVQAGDTLSSVAVKLGTDLPDLLSANPQIADPDVIYPGELIYTAAQNTAVGSAYIVQSGDTLWGIAADILGDGSRYPDIVQANALDGDTIYPGQVLTIPQ